MHRYQVDSNPQPCVNAVPSLSDILNSWYLFSGLTWTMAIIRLILQSSEIEEGRDVPVAAISEQLPIPFMETQRANGESGADLFQNLPSPRFMQTHLPCKLWETQLVKHPNLKVIQTIRNPKDTLVSYYHHMRNEGILGAFNGTWDQFFELFKEKKLPYGDYFEHVTDWLKFFKDRENTLILRYEEMKKDHHGHVIKIARFLDQGTSDRTAEFIVQKTTVQNMSQEVNNVVKNFTTWNKDGNFIRKGEVGDWVNYFSKEQGDYVDAKCKEYLEPMGITFDYHCTK